MGSDPRQDRSVEVGLVLRDGDLRAYRGRLAELTAIVAGAGLDHVTVGDHVSFAGGNGADGLVQATALLSSHPTLPVQTGVYLLALRHPAVVARQLSTISDIAPGRLTFGVGVGGDDPRELELCGVEPKTRGVRTSEALALLREFLTGEEVTFAGRFFNVEGAAIRPAPRPSPTILVGGRSDAALRRTGRLGDGWLALWVSPRRYTEGVGLVQEAAEGGGPSRRRLGAHAAALDRVRSHARACGGAPAHGHGTRLRHGVRALRALLPLRAPGGRRGRARTVPPRRLPALQPRLRGRRPRCGGRCGGRAEGPAVERRGLDAAAAGGDTRDHRRRATACRHWTSNQTLSATTPRATGATAICGPTSPPAWTSIPSKVALILDDRKVTFDELRRAAIGISNKLADGNVGPGDVVVMLGRHSIEAAVAMLGCLHRGAVLAPLPPMFNVTQLSALLEQTRATGLVTFGGEKEIAKCLEVAGEVPFLLTVDAGARRRARGERPR